MKLFVVLCLVSVAYGAPPFDSEILRYDNENIGTGNFRYAYEQSDGTKQEAVGELKNEGREGQAVEVKGLYSWEAPDGYRYVVTYVADALGYRSTIQKESGSRNIVQSLVG